MTKQILPRPEIVMLTFLGIEFVDVAKKLCSSGVFNTPVVLLKSILAN